MNPTRVATEILDLDPVGRSIREGVSQVYPERIVTQEAVTDPADEYAHGPT